MPEVLIAIFIILVGLSAISGIISKIIPVSGLSSLYFEASYLAQEGIELVRNIRDTNLVKVSVHWDDNIFSCQSPPYNCETPPCICDCQADYNDSVLDSYNDEFLKIDANGFYNYDSGNDTLFKRKIEVEKIDDSTILVTAEVSFSFRGETHNFSAEEYIYKWIR